MERTLQSDAFPIGSTLPDFSLPNVDGKQVSASYLTTGKAGLVVFTCNHCPYVKGSEAMLIETIKEFQGQGLVAVAISANDAQQYPEDSFAKMQEKSKSMQLPFPYLYDESQQVAKAFDAACTPEAYLFDNKGVLIYHGALNNSPRDPTQAKTNFLRAAIQQAVSGKKPEPAFVHPMGCSIKWRK